jgi:hypothetical protein
MLRNEGQVDADQAKQTRDSLWYQTLLTIVAFRAPFELKNMATRPAQVASISTVRGLEPPTRDQSTPESALQLSQDFSSKAGPTQLWDYSRDFFERPSCSGTPSGNELTI